LFVNPVTNKIYVVSSEGNSVLLVIDGATNTTTTLAGVRGGAAAVNPVTNRLYVANGTGNEVFVVQDTPVSDTKVRLEYGRLPDDTTVSPRPALTGKAVNRWFPGRTMVMGVGNRANTTQMAWDWANVTSGVGTDSITWAYNWGGDSLNWGENFVCLVPFEDQAAINGSTGLGTPFAGNLEVYAVYRVNPYPGIEENVARPVIRTRMQTIVRGVLLLPRDMTETSDVSDRVPRLSLLDITGRKVLDLHHGANDVRSLAPGVYFVRRPMTEDGRPGAVQKVAVTR